MRVIALAAQKGGTGKTTLAGHLAVQAERKGAGPVAVIDTDAQGSLSAWWNERQVETPRFAATDFARLPYDLQKLEEAGVRLAVIDTPPAITMAIRRVITVADLVLVPTRPSPHDLRAIIATVDIVEDAGRPLIFVINSATQRARITSDAAITLSQYGTVAPTTIHHRTDFATSMIDGRTVMEFKPASRSAQEIETLWDYVASRLARQETKAPVQAAPVRPPMRRGTFGRRVATR
ncbi:MAG: AAA family ATPase [Alphaproteobacteria bacterium]